MLAESFEQAMAGKPSGCYSDAEWYVACVAHCTVQLGLDSANFRFRTKPPNPEIHAMLRRRIPPCEAALALFGVKH